ncbi:uncharacterized protein LOC106384647 [Brassica napus]|uniref:uncharacterized protein LOC106384647 n=1 Tax=Brassica napus TaxID=3708 RepID=UPI0006AA7BD4|nr:uncharacterized protein LOC106384647 [Brassica napus]
MDSNIEWYRNVPQTGQQRRGNGIRSAKWEPPPANWVKCNFDYSSRSDSMEEGIGWIVRDHNGVFLGAGNAKIGKVQSSLIGEAMSFIFALQQIWARGWKRVWFEGDNQKLCLIINQVKEHIDLRNYLCDIRHWMTLLPECSLEYVNREKNQAADAMSRHSRDHNSLYQFFDFPPVWLIQYLYSLFTV